MRYTEEAIEIFGLISKMKDANEPPEYIKEQLRGVVHEIIVPMTMDDDGKPYLMQLAGEVDQIKQAIIMLADQIQTLMTDNDGTRRELTEVRREVASTTEQLSGRIENLSSNLQDEIRKGQQETSVQLRQISERLSRIETNGKRRGLFGWVRQEVKRNKKWRNKYAYSKNNNR
ncbi:hypothetical protein RJP21_14240 [Paenibacillus sp. VCA1]|uniref:hypothetical protein n=1 Tax=Paenibacillus sp. VCA1 TaxID=3039148 RepID=UPI0028720080|nr:hypothetical protein [Paenibacillus sp. VCA1]MDR9854771.1 hypothetical protein [Paenibacillus sp. VCA1]